MSPHPISQGPHFVLLRPPSYSFINLHSDAESPKICSLCILSLSYQIVIVGDEGANPSPPPIISPGGHFIISKDRID